ncbi:sugar ABC transporter permease [Paenibacillus sp. PAMC21692]|uniref:ABC transporter permease n=1 Tax=Paenibacillus sp. PAMC21692 TaxID=2762320 RepID=UPI0021C33870|nr:ABC transporter permease subunit [Paenibacillus sp. PAMC21692]
MEYRDNEMAGRVDRRPNPLGWIGLKQMKRFWFIYLLITPVLVYYGIFRYYPMLVQVTLAFKDFTLLGGIWHSEWIGFDNFTHIFSKNEFYQVLRNTIAISLLRLAFGFLPPIILAILLYDLHSSLLRRISQTLLYIPHFFSWVIMYGLVYALFSNTGLVNHLLEEIGGKAQNFLLDADWFRPLLIGSAIWKEIGWGTIIYLAGMSMIDPSLYDAAKIDGAGPLKRIWHVTLPGLQSVMIFLFTLSLGGILNAGAEQILLFYNPATYSVGDVIDTYVYRQGLGSMQYSMTTAVSLFQSVIGLILVLSSNSISKKLTGTGIW